MRLMGRVLVVWAIAMHGADVLLAQTTVRGELRDSLTGVPFRNTRVEMVPIGNALEDGLVTMSDGTGRFEFRNVARGDYAIGFRHPRLDSLGFEAVSKALRVDGRERTLVADLALPSAITLRQVLCPSSGDSTGVLFGRILNAEGGTIASSATLTIEWSEAVLSAKGVEPVLARMTTKADVDGKYVACGVPVDAVVRVRAGLQADGVQRQSGRVRVRVPSMAPIFYRTLYIANFLADDSVAAGVRARESTELPSVGASVLTLSGIVLDEASQPVASARVRVEDTQVEVIADTRGRFRLARVPSGTIEVAVSAIGYSPVYFAVDMLGGENVERNVVMSRVPAMLDSVTVMGTRASDRVGFFERRRKGRGYFVTANEARLVGAQTVPDALYMAPGIRAGLKGRGGCRPVVYLDGVLFNGDLGRLGSEMDNAVPLSTVGGIEVYNGATDAPAQFGSPGNRPGAPNAGGCAVVVIWTKSNVPDLSEEALNGRRPRE